MSWHAGLRIKHLQRRVVLALMDGPLTRRELSLVTGLDPDNLWTALRVLKSNEWVIDFVCPEDGHSYRLTLIAVDRINKAMEAHRVRAFS